MAAKHPSRPSPQHSPLETADDGGDVESAPPAPRAEQPGERRAIRIITRLEAVKESPELAIDGRQLIADLPPLCQRYLALLLREGPLSNVAAAELLKTQVAPVEAAAAQLDQLLTELLDDPR